MSYRVYKCPALSSDFLNKTTENAIGIACEQALIRAMRACSQATIGTFPDPNPGGGWGRGTPVVMVILQFRAKNVNYNLIVLGLWPMMSLHVILAIVRVFHSFWLYGPIPSCDLFLALWLVMDQTGDARHFLFLNRYMMKRSILIGSLTYKKKTNIDLIHKWRPINYSFIFMLISPPSLVSMCKIQFLL